ncbi:hypothetical protein OEZ86_005950 [Tetradesmus obliquus]|nr:hypothetical protein OEZ86_005950 [Tetradesmus obliquus]
MDLASEQGAPLFATPAVASTPTAHKACRSRAKHCQVVGCCVDLQQLNMRYNLKKRLCPQHLKADAVQVEGCGQQLFRFCQQCGKLEDLARFAGTRRSCRPSLLKRRTLSKAASGDQELACVQQQRRQRRHSSRRADSTAAANASTPDMPDMPAAPEADLEVVAAPSDAQLLELSRACIVPPPAAAAAAALPGSAQAGVRLQRLRVQFETLQHTMEALQELQAQTRELAAAELSWAASEDAMHGVCYY